jgi:HEAT repeat protein
MSADSNAQPYDVSGLVAALGDNNGLVRQHAREELVDIGHPAVPSLRAALASPHEQVRWEAAKALSEIATPESAPGLVTALEDREFSVRWIAAEGLVAIGHRSVEPLLEALVARGDRQWLREGAHHVLKTLSKRGGSYEAIAPVLAALEGMEPELVVPPAAKAALNAMRVSRD